MEGTIKDYLEKLHKEKNDFDKHWENLIAETTSLLNLSENEVLDIFRLFEYPVS